MIKMTISAIAVFCGSKQGKDPVYDRHAQELGYIMADRGITLIYGGGNKGLMGTIANAVMEKNGKVIGVIPEVLLEWEHQHEGITELLVVPDMHTRKRELCDAAIILPGGFGTLDEMFEMLTWNQLSIHDKKIFILNSGGFYTHLYQHIVQLEKDGFLYDAVEKRISLWDNPSALHAVLD
jgi:uncharacterized protein (TIGR00730 family)